MRVSELIRCDSILLHAAIPNMTDALGVLVELQESNAVITNGTAYFKAVCERESSGGSTGIGEGIALPHACNSGVAAAGISAVTLRKGIDWGAADGQPVDVIFMIAVPPEDESEHLLILARLVNLLSENSLTKELRGATSREKFIECLAKAETERFA